MYQIGIDIGGTNVKIGLLNEALELCAEISIPFPHTTAEDMAAQIRAAVGPMLQARGAALSDVESLGAVVPGSIDAAGETVVDAHNLNFHNVPLRKILSDACPSSTPWFMPPLNILPFRMMPPPSPVPSVSSTPVLQPTNAPV